MSRLILNAPLKNTINDILPAMLLINFVNPDLKTDIKLLIPFVTPGNLLNPFPNKKLIPPEIMLLKTIEIIESFVFPVAFVIKFVVKVSVKLITPKAICVLKPERTKAAPPTRPPTNAPTNFSQLQSQFPVVTPSTTVATTWMAVFANANANAPISRANKNPNCPFESKSFTGLFKQ